MSYSRNRKKQSTNFVDYVKLYGASGKGGGGSSHLRRDKLTAKGGPDGGNGGRGGHVILIGDKQIWTLIHLRFKIHNRAEEGGHGGQQTSTGKDGDDIYMKVPLGTVVRDPDTMDILAEITDDGQEYIMFKGGRGGLGNDNFKSSTFQTPRFAQPGEEGEEGWRVLELKLLADVGLVGFPNAGKSTLLSVISAAKPEIANYAFTTLEPNLGVVKYRGDQSFVMADIPGIIEGASEGKGLGMRFLRHIERNSALLFMVPSDADDITKEYEILVNELRKYNPELLDKKRVLAITKGDMLDDELQEALEEEMEIDIPYTFISSVAQQGLTELKDMVWKAIN